MNTLSTFNCCTSINDEYMLLYSQAQKVKEEEKLAEVMAG